MHAEAGEARCLPIQRDRARRVGRIRHDTVAQRRRSTAAMIRAAALLVTVASLGTSTWSEPRTLSDIGISLGPELAMSSAGSALAVWDGELGPDCAQSPASLTCIHL